MVLNIKTSGGSYPVYIERGALKKAAQLIDAEHKVFIVTDSGVPSVWVDCVRGQFPDADLFVFPQGEASKNLNVYEELVSDMLDCGISRNDCVIALGGGVAGDLAGFAAATYMRGIKYVMIPTTTLSQLDSCIGGKTALDVGGTKNIVGAFWQPSAVIIDPDVLSTLPERQFAGGMAEAVKAGVIRDAGLFGIFEEEDYKDHVEEIISRSLKVKKDIVENDEREAGERKLLKFGHTLGHALESCSKQHYSHGECIAAGMIAAAGPGLKDRLKKVLRKMGLPTKAEADKEELSEFMRSDKKASDGSIDIVVADEPGKARIERVSFEELRRRLLA
jgi:3-dehydroquinate synthase